MKVLLGTTNPSKVRRFKGLLRGCNLEFCTPADLGIVQEPQEIGRDPEENAILKAQFYSQFCDRVICNDSGLYFDVLSLHDPRQPGLHVRTPQGGRRLNDEEMIAYYSGLIRSLGGRVLAYYLDSIAVSCQGKIFSFSETPSEAKVNTFYMVDSPSEKRHPGWPLDALSMDRDTGRYFVDRAGDAGQSAEEPNGDRLTHFLKRALGIE